MITSGQWLASSRTSQTGTSSRVRRPRPADRAEAAVRSTSLSEHITRTPRRRIPLTVLCACAAVILAGTGLGVLVFTPHTDASSPNLVPANQGMDVPSLVPTVSTTEPVATVTESVATVTEAVKPSSIPSVGSQRGNASSALTSRTTTADPTPSPSSYTSVPEPTSTTTAPSSSSSVPQSSLVPATNQRSDSCVHEMC